MLCFGSIGKANHVVEFSFFVRRDFGRGADKSGRKRLTDKYLELKSTANAGNELSRVSASLGLATSPASRDLIRPFCSEDNSSSISRFCNDNRTSSTRPDFTRGFRPWLPAVVPLGLQIRIGFPLWSGESQSTRQRDLHSSSPNAIVSACKDNRDHEHIFAIESVNDFEWEFLD